jgi:hypothetical protein
MQVRFRTLLLAGLVAAASTAMAGTVSVTYINPDNFVDAGNSRWDEKANMDELARYVQVLGQRLLPPDQVLKVEVTELDLAGTVRPSRRDGDAIRVVRGRTDFPTISLRYSLESGGKVLRSGTDRLSDLNYARGFDHQRSSYESLHYEKKMLNAWMRGRFVENRASLD